MLVGSNPTPRPWESLNNARKALRDKIHYVRGGGGHKIKECLTYNGMNDFTLNEDSDSVWIQVDDFVVYVRRNEKAVSAEIISPNDCGKTVSVDTAVGYWQEK